jgi:molybdopterin-guanine dinucleotide biosynthesis protein B
MKIFGLMGWSGSGKTTLMVGLLPELTSRGYAVSTMKHSHHGFDVDIPGKDSYCHREAGAIEVMVASARRWALMHELRDQPEPDVETLIARMTPVDLLLIEGFKDHGHAKMEVHRPALGKELICRNDPDVVAVASDFPVVGLPIPVLDLNDVSAIADFVVNYCALQAGVPQGAA